MHEFFESLLPLPEEERKDRLKTLIEPSYALPAQETRSLERSRLEAWLEMAPEEAKAIASSYEAAMKEMPGTIAMRRVEAVRTIATQMPSDEIVRLREIIPDVIGDTPVVTASIRTPPPGAEESAPRQPEAEKTTRPWWAVWRR
jgi:hypothetical protein